MNSTIQSTWWGVAATDKKAKKTLSETKAEWKRFRTIARQEGGVVPIWQAAIRLNLTRQGVKHLITMGQLSSWTFFDRPDIYVSINELEKLAEQRSSASARPIGRE